MEYESNSINKREKREPVVNAPATRVKKTGFQKIASTVAKNVEENDVKGRIVNDIVLPMILDMVNTGLAGMFGIDPRRSRSTLDSIVTTARSSRYWNASNGKTVETTNRTVRTVYDYDDCLYPTKQDAENALRDLDACMEKYNVVKVADLLETSRILPNSTDYNYGWYNIRDAKIIHTVDGWVLRMPEPQPLDK